MSFGMSDQSLTQILEIKQVRLFLNKNKDHDFFIQ